MLCVMCNVLCCYVIKISVLESLVTTNTETIFLGIVPKCELSTLKSNSKTLELD